MSLANLPLNTGETRRLIGSPRADMTLRMMRGAQALPGGLVLPPPGQSYEGLAQALADQFQDPLEQRIGEVRNIMGRDIRNVGTRPYGNVFSPLALIRQQIEQGKISPPDRVPHMNAISLALTMDPDFQGRYGKLAPVLQRVLRQTAARGMLRNQGVPEAELHLGQDERAFERSDPGRMRSIFENVFRGHGEDLAYLETFARLNPEALRQLQKVYGWSLDHPAFQERRGEGEIASRSSRGALIEVRPSLMSSVLRDAGGSVEAAALDAAERMGYVIDRDRYAPSTSMGPFERNVPATRSQLMMFARALGLSPEEVVANPDRFLQAIQEFYRERSQAGIERALGQDPLTFMEPDRPVTGGNPNVAGAVRGGPGNAYAPFNPGGFPETPYRLTPETEQAIAGSVPEFLGELNRAEPRPQRVIEPVGDPSLFDFLSDNAIEEIDHGKENLRNRGRALAAMEMANSINTYRYLLQQARSAPGFDALGEEAAAIGELDTELTGLLDDIRKQGKFDNKHLERLFGVMGQLDDPAGKFAGLMGNELFREIHRDIGVRSASVAYVLNEGAQGRRATHLYNPESSNEDSNKEKRRRNRATDRFNDRRIHSPLYQQEVRPRAMAFTAALGLQVPGSGFPINTADPGRARQVEAQASLDRGARAHLFKMPDPEKSIDLMQRLHDRLHAAGRIRGPRLDVREQLALWETNREPSYSNMEASAYPDSTYENTVHPEVLRRLFGIDLSRLDGLEGTGSEKYGAVRDDRALLQRLNIETNALLEGREPPRARTRDLARDNRALTSRGGQRSLPSGADPNLPPEGQPDLVANLGQALMDTRMEGLIERKVRASKGGVIVLTDRDLSGPLRSPKRLKEFLTIVTGRKFYTEEGGRTHFTVVDQSGKPFTGFGAGEERVDSNDPRPRSEDRRVEVLERMADAIRLDPSLAYLGPEQMASRLGLPIEMLGDVLQSMGLGERTTGGGGSGGALGDGFVARLRALRGVRPR